MKKTNLLILFLAIITQSVFSQTLTGVMTQVPCNNDGIYTVTATGLALPITYTYYLNGTTVVHSGVSSLTDQLTNIPMSDGWISCQATSGGVTRWVSTSYARSFAFSLTATSPTCPATMGTVTATNTGGTTGPFSYSWTNKSTLVSYAGNNASVPVGSYSAKITDLTTGCVLELTDSAAYVSQLTNVTASISVTPAGCSNGAATAVASGGVAPYTYLWSNGATTPTINGLVQGYYSLTVTDALGCQSSFLGANIQQNPNILVNTSVTSATCVQSDGSAIAFGSGGVPPYTYAWSNGQTGSTATNLTGGINYTVVATDANGCIGRGWAWVGVSTPINVTYTSVNSQCTSATGSATLTPTGGTAPYTYSWPSSPSTSGATLSNVGPGTYSFQVTDAVGCVRTGSAIVRPVSTINASVGASTVMCPVAVGNVTANVSGTNPPFTYLWSNGATTSQLTGVPLGSYSCLISDALGCSVSKSASIRVVSPLNISVLPSPASCIYNTDGSAVSTVSGGLAPYTYSYTNGTTTANASGLGVGRYWLTVTDANGCSGSKYFNITNANTTTNCYCTISGRVYVDANSNCVDDPGETGVDNIMMHCSGQGYTFTDANGNYSFQVPSGTYTISEQVHAYYPLSSCQSNNISVSVTAAAGCNSTVDFANNMNVISDLKILTVNSYLPPIPGNSYQQKVVVKNRGTVTESGVQMGYEHDGQLPFANSSLPSFLRLNPVTAPNNYSVQTGFATLNPNASSTMLLNYYTPTNIPIGTTVNFYDSVANMAPIATNWLLDYTPWNNVNTYQTTVIGSYDPNYKEVTPKGNGVQGYILSSTKEFDYTVHFQNEGTYFAQNIYITDQLDSDLDWTTFTPGYSDYDYTTTVSETGLVTFTFKDINLPWKSAYGDALSSGLVSYSIKPKAGSAQGTEFTNYADIYFDYNEPITTNTTVNTINDQLAGGGEIEVDKVKQITVDLYPVPATDLINIRVNNITKGERVTLNIIDIMGKLVLTDQINLSKGSTAVTQDVSDLPNGTYITRLQFDNGTFLIKKIVIL